MRSVITGATGFIGSHLVPALVGRGDVVVVMTRNTDRAHERLGPDIEAVRWDPEAAGDWQKHIDGADAVIHLAGKGVMDDRWTDRVKRQILDSRVITTELVVDAIEKAAERPSVLISGSAVGYYGDRAEPVTEEAPPGDRGDFLVRVCKAWEAAAEPATELGVRTIVTRIGVVLGESGALPELMRPFKFFAGGPVGDGEQHLPWIHIADVVGMLVWCLDNEAVAGPLNVTAPNPPTMKQFMKTLGGVMGRPSWLRAPSFAVKAALGEQAQAVLDGQNAVPAKARALGFEWRFPELRDALRDLLDD